jgi:hypothetical protein
MLKKRRLASAVHSREGRRKRRKSSQRSHVGPGRTVRRDGGSERHDLQFSVQLRTEKHKPRRPLPAAVRIAAHHAVSASLRARDNSRCRHSFRLQAGASSPSRAGQTRPLESSCPCRLRRTIRRRRGAHSAVCGTRTGNRVRRRRAVLAASGREGLCQHQRLGMCRSTKTRRRLLRQRAATSLPVVSYRCGLRARAGQLRRVRRCCRHQQDRLASLRKRHGQRPRRVLGVLVGALPCVRCREPSPRARRRRRCATMADVPPATLDRSVAL